MGTLLIIALAIEILILLMSIKKYGLSHPFCIFLIFSIPYYLAPVFDIFLFGNSKGYSIDKTLLHLVLFLVLSASAFLVQGRNLASTVKKYYLTARFTKTTETILIVAVFIIYASYQIQLVMEFGSSRADIYSNKSVLYDLLRMFIISILVVLQVREKIMYGKPSKLTLMMIICFILPEIVVIGDRRLALILLILSFFIWREYIRIRLKTIIILSGLIISFFIVGLTRSGSEEINYLILLNISNMEFGASQKIFDYCVLTSQCAELSNTLISLPSQMLPEFLYPERGLSAEQKFAKIYNLDYFYTGGTYAYSFFTETILNIGFFGTVLISLGIAVLFLIFNKIKDTFTKDLYGIFILIMLLFLPRMSILSISKQQLVYIFFVTASVFLLNRLYIKK